MIARFVLAVVLAVVMLVGGTSTYLALASRTSQVAAPPQKPTVATPRAFTLPGTLYIAQGGAIYRLSAGRFYQLTPEAGWTMPALSPDGNLLAVRQSVMYSDIYVLSRFGAVVRQVTNNAAPSTKGDPARNHWAFYPKLSGDGKTLWLTYDQPKYGYDVIMSIWAMPIGGTIKQGKLWTSANDYTGGDVQPVPVNGGLMYTKYDYGPDSRLAGRLWFTNRAASAGKALTTFDENCRNPSVSPSGTQIAMICTYGKQLSYLAIASWNGSALGPRQVIINDQMVAQPIWAPDGSGIAYLAPRDPDGPFQLWFLPSAAYAPPAPSPSPSAAAGTTPSPVASPSPAAPVKPIRVTTNNGFDATSPMAWG